MSLRFPAVLVRAVAASLVATAMSSVAVPAQATGGSAAAPAQTRAADPADVASVDAIVRALYESISGPKGAPRDWARLRTLYGPNARMIYTTVGADGKARLANWSVEEYITVAEPGLVANGFYEREIGRTTETFGNVTAIMSAYDSKHAPEDATPFQRGVNSIQLFHSGARWYILSVMWDSERAGNPIPAKYLAPR